MEKTTKKILELIFDEKFRQFENYQESPSIFNAAGRTYTETWHSAFLGWFFDPNGSHMLGTFALERLILLILSENNNNISDFDFELIFAYLFAHKIWLDWKHKTRCYAGYGHIELN